MKALLDACVLYPTFLREVLLTHARRGFFAPLWSDRILEEWARAAGKTGPVDRAIADGEIATLRAAYPDASVEASAPTAERLHLPDPDDVHVLAAAVDGAADRLVTLNLRDFPRRAQEEAGVRAVHPDPFLLTFWNQDADRSGAAIAEALATAKGHGLDVSDPRAILKRARLPRLGKAYSIG